MITFKLQVIVPFIYPKVSVCVLLSVRDWFLVCFLPEDPALPHTCTLHVYVLLFRYLTSLYLCAFFENGSSNDNDGLSLFGDCNCSYFDANSFKIMNSNSSSCEFSVCYLNAKSLCKNFFVIQFHLLYDQQFGFRASYST